MITINITDARRCAVRPCGDGGDRRRVRPFFDTAKKNRGHPRMRKGRAAESRQQQSGPSALSFQDGGPPGLDLKLDGEASDRRRPGEPAEGPRYITRYRDNTPFCVSLRPWGWP